MLLAVDAGNTQTVFGLYDGDRLAEHFRVGRFLSQTQTSSSFRWKKGYVCCGTYVRSSLLQRYVASCVSTQ